MPPRGVKKGSKRDRQYAKKLGIEGRSKMTKKQLQSAVAGAS